GIRAMGAPMRLRTAHSPPLRPRCDGFAGGRGPAEAPDAEAAARRCPHGRRRGSFFLQRDGIAGTRASLVSRALSSLSERRRRDIFIARHSSGSPARGSGGSLDAFGIL